MRILPQLVPADSATPQFARLVQIEVGNQLLEDSRVLPQAGAHIHRHHRQTNLPYLLAMSCHLPVRHKFRQLEEHQN
jgi:hypothetical protein